MVTSTGAGLKPRATLRPPNPAPTMTTDGRAPTGSSIAPSRDEPASDADDSSSAPHSIFVRRTITQDRSYAAHAGHYDRQDQESCRAHNDAAVRLCAPKVRGRAVSLVDLRKNVVDGKRKRPRVRASTRGGAAMRPNERH